MTRQDRELAIADNVAYVDKALAQAIGPRPKAQEDQAQGLALKEQEEPNLGPWPSAFGLIFLGFSQGASMAYRAAVLGRHRGAGIVAIAGDIPPELRISPRASWAPVLLLAGARDEWFTSQKLSEDADWLAQREIPHEVVRFDGGHEWTDEVRSQIGAFLRRVVNRR